MIHDLDGDKLVRMQVKQKKILTRPHEQLDHDDQEVVDTFTEDERLQYQRVEDSTDLIVDDRVAGERSTDEAPEGAVVPGVKTEKEQADELASQMRNSKKVHGVYSSQNIELRARIDKHFGCKYLNTYITGTHMGAVLYMCVNVVGNIHAL